MEFLKLLHEARIKYFCDRDEGVKRPQDPSDKDIDDWLALKPFALVNPDQLRAVIMAAIDYKNAWFDQRDATGNSYVNGWNACAEEHRAFLIDILTAIGPKHTGENHDTMYLLPLSLRSKLLARGWALIKRGNWLNKPNSGFDLERRTKEWEGRR
jgi:hypothetical protein